MTIAHSELIRSAFADAGAAFVACVGSIAPEEWSLTATEAWTVRELVAHTSRSFSTVLDYEAPPDTAIEVASPTDFVCRALATPHVHEGVAARARDTADRIGDDIVGLVDGLVVAAAEQSARLADDARIYTFAGVARYIDFIVTRTAELTLHLADLQLALRRPVDLPESAVALIKPALIELLERLDPTDALLGLSGRAPLNVYA